MHIQEGTNTTLTTCTKMTEEVDRRHGVNGNSSSNGATEDASVNSAALASTGGRLKFFKDGKFILELVRGCAREGERAGWVSVPRKTFWPPAAPAAPCASLSVSDDNSSVHSSPWQRDHCWKQTAPRKNISKELAMYYCRPATLLSAAIRAPARLKRRRPYDTAHIELASDVAAPTRPLTNGVCEKKNGDVGSPDAKGRGDDAVDGAPAKAKSNSDDDRRTEYDREKIYHMKLKKPYQYRKMRTYKKTRSPIIRKELTNVVNRLREKIASLPTPINAKLASCRQEHAMVSPRKRILRELERVSLEDQGSKRRARTAPALSTASYPPAYSPVAPPSAPPALPPVYSPAYPASPGPSHREPARPLEVGPRKDPPVSKNVSSYSIHSLLSMGEESSPESKRSPHSAASLRSDAGGVRSPGSARSPSSTRSPVARSPGAGRSPEPSPSPDALRYRLPLAPGGSPPPDMARWRAARWYRRDDWRDPYGYPYAYVGAQLYRPPPPLWVHYPLAPGAPPGPWAPLAIPIHDEHIPRDEPTSDLPLNLSKH